jgi:hypothetical protein
MRRGVELGEYLTWVRVKEGCGMNLGGAEE